MTDSQKLLELAARVEKAEGPVRELDVAIAQAVWPQLTHYAPHCRGEEPIFWDDPFRKQPCPYFTASIDLALTLVPDGHGGSVHWHPNLMPTAKVWATIHAVQYGIAKSRALALCAAALRARAAI